MPYARADRTVDDWLTHLEGLADTLPSDAGSRRMLRRKIGIVRDRILSWRDGGFERRIEGAAGRAMPPRRPAGESCEAATPVGYGDFAWTAARENPPGTAFWFRFEAPRTGWHRIDTAGSEADTSVAVMAGCSGEPLTENDDSVGLQASVSFRAVAGSTRWIRIALAAARAGGTLVMSASGSGSGILSGVVTEEGTGNFVANARVEIYRSSGSYAGSDWTDATGFYVFSGMSPDSYFLITDDTSDHLDELWDDHPCEPGCTPITGDPIPVSDTVPGVADFELSRGGGISGQLLAAGGGPIVSQRVRLTDSVGTYIADEYSDGTGGFRFGGLSSGIYFAYTSVSGYRNEVWDDIPCDPICQPTNGHVIQVVEGVDTAGIDFTLDSLGVVQGTLTDAANGLPISSGRVELFRNDGSYAGTAYSQASGTWTSSGLQPGIYFVASDLYNSYRNEVYDDIPCQPSCGPLAGTPIQVSLNSTTLGIDQALDRLGALSGTITESHSGFPLPSIRVEVWTNAGGYVGGSDSTQVGHWERPNLQPGTYHVVTSERGIYIDELYDDIPCPGGSTNGCLPQDGTPIALALTEYIPGIDLALDLGGSVSGTLTDELTGEPIPFEDVILTSTTPPSGLVRSTDSSGHYLFPGLLAGDYFAYTATDTHADEIWDDLPCTPDSCDPNTGTPIPVELGLMSSGVDFGLVLLGGLAGVVQDESGAGLSTVVLQVWNSTGNLVAGAVTDADGRYQIDLSSGVFFLSTLNTYGLPDELWNEIHCPGGAGAGCDPLGGDSILLVGADPVLTGFDFELGPTIFADGFESGDVSAWSSSIP